MSEELKINERHLHDVAGVLKKAFEVFTPLIESLENKEADIFKRYIAYVKARATIDLLEFGLVFSQSQTSLGHSLAHPLLNTDAAKKADWTLQSISNSPFFIQNGGD